MGSTLVNEGMHAILQELAGSVSVHLCVGDDSAANLSTFLISLTVELSSSRFSVTAKSNTQCMHLKTACTVQVIYTSIQEDNQLFIIASL